MLALFELQIAGYRDNPANVTIRQYGQNKQTLILVLSLSESHSKDKKEDPIGPNDADCYKGCAQ